MSERPARILPVIVASQLAGSSPWFAGNAVLPDLQSRLGLPDHALGHITAAVQLGFIAGTLVFAILAISDRYSPRVTFSRSRARSAMRERTGRAARLPCSSPGSRPGSSSRASTRWA